MPYNLRMYNFLLRVRQFVVYLMMISYNPTFLTHMRERPILVTMLFPQVVLLHIRGLQVMEALTNWHLRSIEALHLDIEINVDRESEACTCFFLQTFVQTNTTIREVRLVIRDTTIYDQHCLLNLNLINLCKCLAGLSVRYCQIVYYERADDKGIMWVHGTRDTKDSFIFGRVLTQDEKLFFAEISTPNSEYN